jgi:hypothetical protein
MTEETMFKQAYLFIYKTKNGHIGTEFLYAPNAILAYITVLNTDNVEEIIYIRSKYETD